MKKGTKFILYLPIKRGAGTLAMETEYSEVKRFAPEITSTALPTVPTQNSKLSTQNSNLPLLLIIEDNKDVIAYTESILKKDYRIETALDGQAGIDKALEIIPDIIITDVMMPEKVGFEVCQTLTQVPYVVPNF